ncbi:Helix-turn-helix domain-containing protein [Actinopolymorpha cephalotaxi]|uniref:Helix-turn-helix domain-containing protein n=1 Tax=Actinopolymorpha cephalotaxi TaxID=504797 RepID=A0A1I2QPH3_9ACTN|nr:helix-turn-helix transcriptional regulator [Actinopolymorpha cephalotaxi]NYH82562.1 ribosome-binding protein aMBF1 (putative translation factor) [Actinopolymorpha cephalotaxi]SFG29920.1 Helix-turn-helix domain-containing protein [Actinopolymorpha cephalotaxi]
MANEPSRASADSSDSAAGDDDLPVMPGFREMALRRRALAESLVDLRRRSGLSQTQVAARMGTSQSAVARLEAGEADVRLSTLERYAAAVGHRLDVRLGGDT